MGGQRSTFRGPMVLDLGGPMVWGQWSWGQIGLPPTGHTVVIRPDSRQRSGPCYERGGVCYVS